MMLTIKTIIYSLNNNGKTTMTAINCSSYSVITSKLLSSYTRIVWKSSDSTYTFTVELLLYYCKVLVLMVIAQTPNGSTLRHNN